MDRVRPLKAETISGGGSQDNVYPYDLDPNEDGVEARGLVIQNDTSNDTTVEISRDSSDNMTFKDGVVPGTWTLEQLIYPTVIQCADETSDGTTSSSWVQSCRFSPSLLAKKYAIFYSLELYSDSVGAAGRARLQMNDTTTIVEGRTASTMGKPPHITVSGVYFFDNSGGSPGTFNFDVDFLAEVQTVYVQRKRLMIFEVLEAT